MKLNEQESEIVSGFLQHQWNSFLKFSEDAISINTIHQIAEKIGLNNDAPPNND